MNLPLHKLRPGTGTPLHETVPSALHAALQRLQAGSPDQNSMLATDTGLPAPTAEGSALSARPTRATRRASLPGNQAAALRRSDRSDRDDRRDATETAEASASRQPAPRRAPLPASKPQTVRRTAPAAKRAGERVGNDLQALGSVAQRLREAQLRAAAEEAARRAAAAQREAERNLFSRAVGAITPLPERNLAALRSHQPPPLPVQHWLDEERVLLESISDDFDVSTLLDTDDQLSFRRPGIGLEITHRLRSGHWSIQRQLDLHGLRVDEAREALGDFIRNAHRAGLRCLRVVHGKGLGSPGKSPVLKSRVQRWLVQKNEVLAFVQARPVDGGAGALLVLLKPSQQRKIAQG